MGVSRVDYDNETLIDLSNDTVTPQTLAKGYTAHNSNGEQIVGTLDSEGGGGSVEEIVWITGDLDMATMTVNNMSHTHAEIVEFINQGKKIEFRVSAAGSYAYGTLCFYNPMEDRPCFYAMFQENLGYGLMLYYFNVHIYADNSVAVTPYVVNTTGMGG
jgi:hypothetical protein